MINRNIRSFPKNRRSGFTNCLMTDNIANLQALNDRQSVKFRESLGVFA